MEMPSSSAGFHTKPNAITEVNPFEFHWQELLAAFVISLIFTLSVVLGFFAPAYFL